MLRPVLRSSRLTQLQRSLGASTARTFATQSGDDAANPSALARIYMEDGTVLTGRSFGAHEAVEGEVSAGYDIIISNLFQVNYLKSTEPTHIFLGRLRHRYGGIPRIFDRPLVSGTDLMLDSAYDWKLWCARPQNHG
jgi:hypothetical protein